MNYHDRQRITESLDTSGLLKLCELSVDGGFEHQPPEKLSEMIAPVPANTNANVPIPSAR